MHSSRLVILDADDPPTAPPLNSNESSHRPFRPGLRSAAFRASLVWELVYSYHIWSAETRRFGDPTSQSHPGTEFDFQPQFPSMFSRLALSLIIALFLAVAAMAAPPGVEEAVAAAKAQAKAQAEALKEAGKAATEAAKKKCLESPNAPEGVSADCEGWIITDTTCVGYVLGPITRLMIGR